MKLVISAKKYANCDYTVEMYETDFGYLIYVHYANSEIEIYKHNDADRAFDTFFAVCDSNGMTEYRDNLGNRWYEAPVLEKIGA